MGDRRLWHVTLTVGGAPQPPPSVRAALERLAAEQPFLLSGRYGDTCAELCYWEEAETCDDACALALRLWGEHRTTAQLPPWHVVGLEVVDRDLAERRQNGAELQVVVTPVAAASPGGSWRPLTR